MYAVLMTGGKQYRVEAGSTLVVEKIGGEPGSSVTFERILLVGDGDAVTVGSPTVAGASVSATVLGEALGPKIVVFKFKQKVKYRRRTGHRQHLTRLRIDSISAHGKTVKAQPPEPAAPVAAATPARTPRRAVKAQAPKPTRRQAATGIGGAEAGQANEGLKRDGDHGGRRGGIIGPGNEAQAQDAPDDQAEHRVGQGGVAHGTQEGRLVKQERSRQRWPAARCQARRWPAG